MDPITAMVFLAQAARLANTLAEQVGSKDMTPEEALAKWQAQAASWSASVEMWKQTPSG